MQRFLRRHLPHSEPKRARVGPYYDCLSDGEEVREAAQSCHGAILRQKTVAPTFDLKEFQFGGLGWIVKESSRCLEKTVLTIRRPSRT